MFPDHVGSTSRAAVRISERRALDISFASAAASKSSAVSIINRTNLKSVSGLAAPFRKSVAWARKLPFIRVAFALSRTLKSSEKLDVHEFTISIAMQHGYFAFPIVPIRIRTEIGLGTRT
jgi:hypothetical protein